MALNEVIDRIPDFGRDIRLNLENVLTEEGAPGLTAAQIDGLALACAFSLGSAPLISVLTERFAP